MLKSNLKQASQLLATCLGERKPRIGIILGSGFNYFADEIENAVTIPFNEIPGMKKSTAAGHVGQFVCGNLADEEIFCMQGRLHGYEGYSSQDVAYPVWLMACLGIKMLLITNAAGAINESYAVGEFCIISDHINFTGRNPIADAQAAALSNRHFSMTDAYNRELRLLAQRVAAEEKIPVHEGVYLGLLGPSFETPAEIKAFRTWGADAVGMSTVEEVIAARHADIKVLGISLMTNMAAGIQGASPTAEEVIEVTQRCKNDSSRLIQGIIATL